MEQKTSVVLTCGDRFEGAEIRWRKNQHDIPAKGNSIEVSIEAMLGGNFTCHGASGDVLNHTLVLVSPLDFDKAVLLPNGNKGNGKRTKKPPRRIINASEPLRGASTLYQVKRTKSKSRYF